MFAERFRREGMHVSQLDHPNIIPIYDAGSDKGRLFLAMRLVDGMTLAERIRADPLSATKLCAFSGRSLTGSIARTPPGSSTATSSHRTSC